MKLQTFIVILTFFWLILQKQPFVGVLQMFHKQAYLKIFAKLARKHLCRSLIFTYKPTPATLLKNRLRHSCFPVNFAK